MYEDVGKLRYGFMHSNVDRKRRDKYKILMENCLGKWSLQNLRRL
jgi:hypothetical protein